MSKLSNISDDYDVGHIAGIDSIRGIAAISIILCHLNKNLVNIGFNSFDNISSTIGVNVFFTLSGFLITYLLVTEKNNSSNINIKNFYIKRILRIWPLYFLYLFLATIIIIITRPELFNFNSFLLYMFFCPNIAWIESIGLPMLNHYWSLGVEEQFYVFWPIILHKFNKRFYLKITLLLIVLFIILNIAIIQFDKNDFTSSFVYAMQFHSILIGCLGALIFLEYNFIFNKIKLNLIYRFSWAALILIYFFWDSYSITKELLVACSTSLILLNLFNKNKEQNSLLENQWLVYLGKISFGLYVYHELIIKFTTRIIIYLNFERNPLGFIFYVLLIFCGTFFISAISYQYYEKFFLKLKSKYK